MGAAPCFFHFISYFTSGFVPVFFRLFPVFYFIMKKKNRPKCAAHRQNHFFRLKYQTSSATTSPDTAATVA